MTDSTESMAGENIPYRKDFNFEEYMKSIGRWPRPIIQRGDVPALPQQRSWRSIQDHLCVDVRAPKIDGDFRVILNSEKGPNSYFGAVALLIYGGAKYWFWVRIQHLQYFEQVIGGSETHPRHAIYTRFNQETSGDNLSTLKERLGYADCWVDHSIIQQVTADLYDIYLTVICYHNGSAVSLAGATFDSIQRRGNPLSPGRFLLYTKGIRYQPCLQPIEYVDPSRLDPNVRKPYPDVRIPMPEVCPSPIETLVLSNVDQYLSRILWVDFNTSDPIQLSLSREQNPFSTGSLSSKTSARQDSGLLRDLTCSRINEFFDSCSLGAASSSSAPDLSSSPGATNLSTPSPPQHSNESVALLNDDIEVSLSLPTRDIENASQAQVAKTTCDTAPKNYARFKIAELERMISDREVRIPAEVSGEESMLKRKRLYAFYLEAADLQAQNGGRTLSDILDFSDGRRTVTSSVVTTTSKDREERDGSVLRHITTKSITRITTSVPACWVPVRKEANPVPRDAINFYELDEKQLIQLLLGVNLTVTGDRETDIEKYRKWRRKFYRARQRESEALGRQIEKFAEIEKEPSGGSKSTNGQNPQLSEPDSGSEEEEECTVQPAPEEEEDYDESKDKTAVEEEGEDGEDTLPSSPEPPSPDQVIYSTLSAAALRRDAAARIPPLKVDWRETAIRTKMTLPPILVALDEKARERRDEIRAEKRARAEVHRVAAVKRQREAERDVRPAKRTKTTKEGVEESSDEGMAVGICAVDDDLGVKTTKD